MEISVIIPTMNRQASLLRTIQYILKGKILPEQIIIVDQSDSEKKRSENRYAVESLLKDKTVLEYISLDVASLTHARNTGLGKASGDIIVFMDDDVDVREETVSNIRILMEDPTVAMIAGIDESMPIARSKLGYIMGTKSLKNHAIGHVTHAVLGRFPDHEILKDTSTQWAMGFFFVIRKSLCDKWDIWFDENFRSYAYAEDLDFTYRYYMKSSKENLKCILSPLIKVVHNESKEWRIANRKSTFMYVVHRVYLQYKFWSGKYELALKWAFLGLYFYKKFHHENMADYKDALLFSRKYKMDIVGGNMHYELWN